MTEMASPFTFYFSCHKGIPVHFAKNSTFPAITEPHASTRERT